MIDLILLSAGLGSRMGLGYPKQFARLRGKPLLIHTLEIFRASSRIDKIILSVRWEFLSKYRELFEIYGIKNLVLVEGGDTRQESVKFCLEEVTAPRVMIHEAARPFITEQFIDSLLQIEADVVVPVLPISFAVCEIGTRRKIDKSNLRNIQLPQVFDTRKLKLAHSRVQEVFDEDSVLVYRDDPLNSIIFVDGLEENIKITTPLDLKIAEVLYNERYDIDNRG